MRTAPSPHIPETADRALALLVDAYQTAAANDQPPEQQAYAVTGLEHQGVTQTAMRWLVACELATHFRETTTRRSRTRTFAPCSNSRFEADSCLVLTPAGWERAGRPADREEVPSPSDKPTWDAVLGVLRVGGVVVKRLTREAESLSPLLAAFQAAGWPELIPNPLPSEHGVDASERLRNAVKRLNRLRGPVRVQFHVLRSATAVRWDVATSPAAAAGRAGTWGRKDGRRIV